jgi:hypothetical protein
MSGPFGSSQWMYASGGFYPYQIEQSLRFNDDDSAYLSRTPASAGNRKTWTWSAWVKRGNLGGTQILFSAVNPTFDGITFETDKIRLTLASGAVGEIETNAVFRDPSSWYHLVAVIDTTDATSTDRMRLYINGERVTSFSAAAYPSLNYDGFINQTIEHNVANRVGTSLTFDGYMAEVNFIDGTALDPTSFGETKSGIWVPKAYSGSYGTNGFYLSFADSAAIGDDLSGNGNDWTANNLVATDVVLDSPTQNWCVFNRGEPQANVYTFSEGNLKVVSPSTGFPYLLSTMYVASGKWYGEFLLNSSSGFELVGIETAPFYGNKLIGADADGWGYASWDGNFLNNSSGTAYGNTYTTNDIIGVALDLDNGYLYFSKNGVWQNSGDPASGASGTGGIDISSIAGTAVSMGVSDNDNGGSSTFTANFGQDSSFAGATTAGGNTDANGLGDFKYSVPASYLSLCTANLPDPVIDPAQDDVPADYFNTVLYSGNSSTQSITGVGFQPDWVWLKSRSTAGSPHALFDAVRGVSKFLQSDQTQSELDFSADVTSFDSDGFGLTHSASSNVSNTSGRTYVAWNWLAGNGTSSNTDGTITSTVSVNQKAGFSVVSYTGTAGGTQTVGHGLGAAPVFIISKNRTDAGTDWYTATGFLSGWNWNSDYFKLNTTGAKATDGGGTVFPVAPTSAVFTIGDAATNGSGKNYIAYCFAEVEGYSKFGSYTGNGSTDGPFVYCGFRPAWVMVKRTDSADNWNIVDVKRDTGNVADHYLNADASSAEGIFTIVDILSNGFKARDALSTSVSGGTYIFMAFAESPFKYANAR